jgi:putative transposase
LSLRIVLDRCYVNRKSNRYKNYDYSSDGYYFITVCSGGMLPSFGRIQENEVFLNKYGKIIEDRWKWLSRNYDYVLSGEFVIMPNHFHGILIIDTLPVGTSRDLSESLTYKNRTARELSLPKIKSVSELIGAFKSTSSAFIRKEGLKEFRWQRSFYDRIIRNQNELNNITGYIQDNPKNWNNDEYHHDGNNKYRDKS